MSDKFEEAYRRARGKVGATAWRQLSDKEQEEAVAAELRRIEDEGNGETGGGDNQSGRGGSAPVPQILNRRAPAT